MTTSSQLEPTIYGIFSAPLQSPTVDGYSISASWFVACARNDGIVSYSPLGTGLGDYIAGVPGPVEVAVDDSGNAFALCDPSGDLRRLVFATRSHSVLVPGLLRPKGLVWVGRFLYTTVDAGTGPSAPRRLIRIDPTSGAVSVVREPAQPFLSRLSRSPIPSVIVGISDDFSTVGWFDLSSGTSGSTNLAVADVAQLPTGDLLACLADGRLVQLDRNTMAITADWSWTFADTQFKTRAVSTSAIGVARLVGNPDGPFPSAFWHLHISGTDQATPFAVDVSEVGTVPGPFALSQVGQGASLVALVNADIPGVRVRGGVRLVAQDNRLPAPQAPGETSAGTRAPAPQAPGSSTVRAPAPQAPSDTY